jgi:abequosyltransferase
MTHEADAAEVRLSICIPTYNFGAFIGETLASIIPQLLEGVEIVILDGGSTDDTTGVVESFQASCPAIRYRRQSERGGIDRDIIATIEFARGRYCWLFSADDTMKPGALAHVLDRLGSGCDVYLCGLTRCTFSMEPVMDHPVAAIDSEREFDLASVSERREYFARALTTTAFFSFAGSLIINRESWERAGPDERFFGSLWAHVAQILRMIPGGLRLHYIPAALLNKRADNDSFMEGGLVHRFAIAIDGYHALASAYFSEHSPEARDMRRVVANEFPPWMFLAARLGARRARSGEEAEVDRLAAAAYSEPTARNRLHHAVYRLTPNFLFAAAQAFNRRVVLRWRRVY